MLFADLKGSMELLADRDPEEARRLLDPVLERMMEAVHRYEGTVNQVMGDGIMALFGAPLAHEDHAVRACRAAVRMHETVGGYAEELRRAQGLDVQIRVGLNSGEVVVRAIDNDLHMDYSAIGQTTHLAARMEQLARPGTTLLTADTLRLAEGYIEVRPVGPVPVKGLPLPVEIYELVRFGPVRSRLQAAAVRGLTPFVGRDREVDKLREVRERAAAGHGQIVAVAGEPGVGKSRLLWEFTHSHRINGWRDPGVHGHVARQDDLVSAGERHAERLLPDRRARRRAPDPGEGHREAHHARRDPARRLAGLLPAARRVGGRSGMAGSGSRTSGAAARSTRSSGCCCARARSSRSSSSSKACTGWTRRRRRSWTASWRVCRPPARSCS